MRLIDCLRGRTESFPENECSLNDNIIAGIRALQLTGDEQTTHLLAAKLASKIRILSKIYYYTPLARLSKPYEQATRQLNELESDSKLKDILAWLASLNRAADLSNDPKIKRRLYQRMRIVSMGNKELLSRYDEAKRRVEQLERQFSPGGLTEAQYLQRHPCTPAIAILPKAYSNTSTLYRRIMLVIADPKNPGRVESVSLGRFVPGELPAEPINHGPLWQRQEIMGKNPNFVPICVRKLPPKTDIFPIL